MSGILKLYLGLDDGYMDEDISLTLTSLVVSAVRDESAVAPLDKILQAVQAADCTGSLEPLTLVPLLVPSSKSGASDLLHIMCEQCSPKECVMAAQEAVEHLLHLAQLGELEEQHETLSAFRQVERLAEVYAKCIPRVPKRKSTPSEAVEPIFSELVSLLSELSGNCSSEESRSFLDTMTESILALSTWVANVSTSTEDRSRCFVYLYNLLRAAVGACTNTLRTGRARAAFADHYSRLLLPEEGANAASLDDVGSKLWAALDALGRTTFDMESQPSLFSLVLLAHKPGYTMSLTTLASFFPVILPAAQSNVALDEVLYLLITTIASLRSQSPRPDLPPDLTVPLVHVLPHLAGIHPDPATRHQTFRLLSTVLVLTPSPLRLHLLHDLITDDESSPQMRVAAVGLVREAALEALATKPGSAESGRNVFLSPMFLQRLGPSLLRTNPPDLLDSGNLSLDDFMETPEPLRLVECLTFVYTLVQRDTQNRTGIRDRSTLWSFKSSVLSSLRLMLDKWNQEVEERVTDGEHDIMQLGILDMWVQRTTDAVDGAM